MTTATATTTPTLRLWDPAGLPNHWVVENEDTGELWMVPVRDNGFAYRKPYRGHREALRPVQGYCWMGLGAPLRRPWPEVCYDSEGRN